MSIQEELRWMEAIHYQYWMWNEPQELTWHRQWLSQEISKRKKALFKARRKHD